MSGCPGLHCAGCSDGGPLAVGAVVAVVVVAAGASAVAGEVLAGVLVAAVVAVLVLGAGGALFVRRVNGGRLLPPVTQLGPSVWRPGTPDAAQRAALQAAGPAAVRQARLHRQLARKQPIPAEILRTGPVPLPGRQITRRAGR